MAMREVWQGMKLTHHTLGCAMLDGKSRMRKSWFKWLATCELCSNTYQLSKLVLNTEHPWPETVLQ